MKVLTNQNTLLELLFLLSLLLLLLKITKLEVREIIASKKINTIFI